MLTITTKTQYGLTALLDLAEQFGSGLVQISDIVKRHNVPRNYLEQILNRLSKTGMIKSVRGNKGGFELALHPDNISLINIIEALEGEITLNNDKSNAVLGEILEKTENAVKDILNVALSQLLERRRNLDQQVLYSI